MSSYTAEKTWRTSSKKRKAFRQAGDDRELDGELSHEEPELEVRAHNEDSKVRPETFVELMQMIDSKGGD